MSKNRCSLADMEERKHFAAPIRLGSDKMTHACRKAARRGRF